MRAIFFDEDDAAAAVARLRADGFDADLSRETLAGEDDDQDHPWAVTSDAPEVVLELLVEHFDGWLDHEAPEVPVRPATSLPDLPGMPRTRTGRATEE